MQSKINIIKTFLEQIKKIWFFYVWKKSDNSLIFRYKDSLDNYNILYSTNSDDCIYKTLYWWVKLTNFWEIQEDISTQFKKLYLLIIFFEKKLSFNDFFELLEEYKYLFIKNNLDRCNIEILSYRSSSSQNFVWNYWYVIEWFNPISRNKVIIVWPYHKVYFNNLSKKVLKIWKKLSQVTKNILAFSKINWKRFIKSELLDWELWYFAVYDYINNSNFDFFDPYYINKILLSLEKLHSIWKKKIEDYHYWYIQSDPNKWNFLFTGDDIAIIDYISIDYQMISFQAPMLFIKYIDASKVYNHEISKINEVFYLIYDFYVSRYLDEIDFLSVYNESYFESYENSWYIKKYLNENKDLLKDIYNKIRLKYWLEKY